MQAKEERLHPELGSSELSVLGGAVHSGGEDLPGVIEPMSESSHAEQRIVTLATGSRNGIDRALAESPKGELG